MGHEEKSWPKGLKKTKQRLAVYETLEQAESPMTAMELATRLGQRGEGVWLSTVYRVLDTFEEKGIVEKTQVLDSGIAIYELADGHHRHYAVCVLCGRVIAMENCPMDRFLPRLSESDFRVIGHRLQMYGYCGGCAGGQGKGQQ